jgi:hypothetical protein
MISITGIQVAIGVASIGEIILQYVGLAALGSSGRLIIVLASYQMMVASYGSTIDTPSTMTACTAGVIGRPRGIGVLDGIWQELRCSSTVVTLECSSGTGVTTPQTDGRQYVHAEGDMENTASSTAMVFSERTPSTLLNAVGVQA